MKTETFECRACSNTEFKPGPTTHFRACTYCGGLTGFGTANQIAKVITLEFCTPEEGKATGDFGLTFFDITITGEKKTSCHGWFNPSTKMVHQFG